MIFRRHIAIAFAFAVVCVCSDIVIGQSAATKPSADQTAASLLEMKTAKLSDIEPMIRPGKWPTVSSARAIRGQPEVERSLNRQHLQLARRLLDRMGEFERQAGALNAEEASRVVTMYLSMADNLNECGGYVNLLLADSAKRLAVAHALRFVVKHPGEAKLRQRWSEQLDRSPFPTERLADAVSTETTRRHAELSIEGLRGPEAAEALLKLCDSSFERAVGGNPKDQAITVLIDDVNVEILLGRTIVTDYLSRNVMTALVVFLNRGGKLDVVTAEDDAEFVRIMGDRAKMFESKVMRIPEMTVDRLRVIVEDVLSEHPKVIV